MNNLQKEESKQGLSKQNIKLKSLPPNVKKILFAVSQEVPNDMELGKLIRLWSFEN
jgi:hypothetical protein